MSDLKNTSQENEKSKEMSDLNTSEKSDATPTRKGPLSFLSGSMTSFLLAWLCLGLSGKLVEYFTLHSPDYSSPIAQSAASGLKTLVIGTSFLATFSFAFIGLGLFIVFIRSLFDGKDLDAA